MVKKIIWFVSIMAMPTFLTWLMYIYKRQIGIGTAVFHYSITIVFVFLIVWKKPGNLFSLPIGFLISPTFVSLFESLYNRGAGFGGTSLAVALALGIYAVPFALITLIIAICVTVDDNKKKCEDNY